MVRAQKLASEVAGSSPAFPAFEKWSKPRLKRELRKLDSKLSKLGWGLHHWMYVFSPRRSNERISRMRRLDQRRKAVRMELKSRGKTKRLDAMKCT